MECHAYQQKNTGPSICDYDRSDAKHNEYQEFLGSWNYVDYIFYPKNIYQKSLINR